MDAENLVRKAHALHEAKGGIVRWGWRGKGEWGLARMQVDSMGTHPERATCKPQRVAGHRQPAKRRPATGDLYL